ncbi:MAG: hydantoinase B/oxoprolinase family protein, partial [Gemmatimonadota bacterium]
MIEVVIDPPHRTLDGKNGASHGMYADATVMQTAEPIRDPVRLEVYRHLLTALAGEMGATLRRSAHSPNIKERRDYSCAVFDAAAEPVAMGDHMPVHLGAMPMSVKAALAELGPLGPGDVAALNDPFRGGTHLPDITLVMPVFVGAGDDGAGDDPGATSGPGATARSPGRPLAYVAARAHHADVGGMAAGSMPLAREIYQEGLRIPPVRLLAGGRRVDDAWRLVLANVRPPDERAGDLEAQLAALVAGRRRLEELAARRGVDEVRAVMAGLLAYADRLLRAGIRAIPDGVYEAED